ncbi:MAG: iron-containing alcohol dehydrogenase [Bacteroidia bacterium]
MVNAFQWAASPAIHFGIGKRDLIVPLAASFGERLLILTGGQSFATSEYWTDLQAACETQKLQWRSHSIVGEPSPAMIDACVAQYRDWQPQVVIAIGGGSVLDAGKAIAAMFTEIEGVKSYLEGVGTAQPSGTTLPFIAVPTTSGTGSETTKNAVLSEVGINGFKKSLRHDAYIPNIAILDPELTRSAPPEVSMRSGMDAFTQLLEAYLSTKASPISDALALDGLRLIKDCLPAVWYDGDNLSARAGMSHAAMLSGLCLANAGLGLVHGFASSIGGRIDIPHGLLCARLMAPVNRITLHAIRERQAWSPALAKYVAVGKLFHPQLSHKSDAYYADALIDTMARWTEKFDLAEISAFGMAADMIPEIVAQSSQKNHPIELTAEEVASCLGS